MMTGLMNAPVAALVVCPMDGDAEAGCCCCSDVEGFDGLAVMPEPVTCCSVETADPPAAPVPAVFISSIKVPLESVFAGLGSSQVTFCTTAVSISNFTLVLLAHPPPSPPVYQLNCAFLI
jgi:hypothetical protein